MAYVSQELKAKLAPKIKAVFKKYGIKGSLAVRHHSTLVINIKQGKLDFIGNFNETLKTRPVPSYAQPATTYVDVNPYWFKEHYTGKVKTFLTELFAAANEGNYDKSDLQSDYHCVGWYVDVNVGTWNKPYALVK
jgi:hypothetical protein